MFLPVLLVRDFGPWSWVLFAVPNVAGAAALALAGGTADGSASDAAETGESAEEAPLRIGITKIVAHPALDALENGLMEVVSASYPDTVYDNQNANGDVNTAASIAQKFKADGVDIAVGIATPTAQALGLTTLARRLTKVHSPMAWCDAWITTAVARERLGVQ